MDDVPRGEDPLLDVDADPTIDRVRAALRSTDDELDRDALRVRLLLEDPDLGRRSPSPRRPRRLAVTVAVGTFVTLSAVGVNGLARWHDDVRSGPSTAVPAESDHRGAESPPFGSESVDARSLLTQVDKAVARTPLTAFIRTAAADASARSGSRSVARVVDSPVASAGRRVRADVENSTYVQPYNQDHQLLIDRAARHAWLAGLEDETLRRKIDLDHLDPLVALAAAADDPAATAIQTATPGGLSTMQVRRAGFFLSCDIDLSTQLPSRCRTFRTSGGGPTFTSTFNWRALTDVEVRSTFSVAEPTGYTWTRLG